MRIAFFGTHCTGKTTLATKLAKQLNIPYLGNITRRLHAEGVPFNEKGTEYTQMRVVAEHIKHLQQPNFISDRSLVDAAAYTAYLAKKNKLPWNLYVAILNIVDVYITNYDYLFYLPPEIPLKADGERSINPEFRNDVDNCIQTITRIKNYKFYTITGTIQERLNKIIQIIHTDVINK